jgi:type II secretory pathway component PulF
MADERVRMRMLSWRRVAALLHAGKSLSAAFHSVGVQNTDRALGRAFLSAAQRMESGSSLEDALEGEVPIIPAFEKTLLSAGWHAGRLEQSVSFLADGLETEWQIRRELRLRTLYPKIVAACAWIVIPMAAALLSGNNPLGLLLHRLLVLGAAVSLYCLLSGLWRGMGRRYPSLATQLERSVWNTPGTGRVARHAAWCRFLRNLWMLLESGFSSGAAVGIAARSAGSATIQETGDAAEKDATHGLPLTRAFHAAGSLPNDLLELLESGEQAGRLPEACRRAADMLQHDVEETSSKLSFLAGQALLLFVGLSIIGGVVPGRLLTVTTRG